MENIKVKVNITVNRSLKFDQEVELITQTQKEKYEKLFEDIQNVLSETLYENSEMIPEQSMPRNMENNENPENSQEEGENLNENGTSDKDNDEREPTEEEMMQQEKERKIKRKLDELVNEIIEENLENIMGETQERDLIKLFRKMEKDKKKGMLSGYLFGETFECEKEQFRKTSGQLHREIHARNARVYIKNSRGECKKSCKRIQNV